MATPTENNANNNAPEAAPKKKLNVRFMVVLVLLIVGGGAFGITKYIHAQHNEDTDDAQIESNVSPIIPRVSGYINQVRVKDNDVVKKGDTLIVLDDRDLVIKVTQAEAALAAAQSGLSVASATTTASEANVLTNVLHGSERSHSQRTDTGGTGKRNPRHAGL